MYNKPSGRVVQSDVKFDSRKISCTCVGNGKAFFFKKKLRLSIFMHLALCPHVRTSRLSGALYYERYEHFGTHVNSCCESDKNTGRVTRRPRRLSAVTRQQLACDWLYVYRNKSYKESLNDNEREFFSTAGFLKSCSFRGTRLLLYRYILYLLSFSLSEFLKSAVCVSYSESYLNII
jgi:hypothetical protein